jgi:uncharacterized protein (TIGR02677 family)
MRLFADSKERLVFRLSPEDVLESARASVPQETWDLPEIESALAQLCDWGNLQTEPDISDVGSVEDFFKLRHRFRMTPEGEAAERAIALFQASDRRPELQYGPLADIRLTIAQLAELWRIDEPDADNAYRTLRMLQTSFRNARDAAGAFIESLDALVHSQAPDAGEWIDFGERFLSELVLVTDAVCETIREIEPPRFERFLQAAADGAVRVGLERTPQRCDDARRELRAHWESFCKWFSSEAGRPSSAEALREHARSSMAALLTILANANEQRIRRIDRSNDFRTLARWFAESESDADAHRLWRAVFGLCPARHLTVNDRTLDDHEAQKVPANASWMEAPPFRIPDQIRDFGLHSRIGMWSRIIDRTEEKEKLAAATREEALRILDAQRRFGTGRRMRLSELDHLESAEFDLFLDLLSEAVSARVFATEPVEILSADGCLRVSLEPTGDGSEALILTTEGVFSGPDYWIGIEHVADEAPV